MAGQQTACTALRNVRTATAAHAALLRHFHLTQAFEMVALTAPLLVIIGTPRYTHTPSATAGKKQWERQRELKQP